jgi:hypothetical protein
MRRRGFYPVKISIQAKSDIDHRSIQKNYFAHHVHPELKQNHHKNINSWTGSKK